MRRLLKSAGFLPLCLFLLYAFTAQRGVAWQDSGVLQLRIFYRDLAGTSGLACAHPLYIGFGHELCGALGHALGMEAPLAANLTSAFWMALALGVFLRAARSFSGSGTAAALAALALGLSHMAWWLATTAESYAMALFFIACETECVLRALRGENVFFSCLGAAFSAGMGFSTHNLSLLSLPISAVALGHALLRAPPAPGRLPRLLRRAGAAAAFAAMALCWLLGSWPIRHLAGCLLRGGMGLGEVVRDLLLGNYGREVAGLSHLPWKITAMNLALAAMSVASPCWLAGLLNLPPAWRAISRRRRLSPPALYVGALFLVHAVFFFRYRIADQATFVLPSLFFASLLLSKLLARAGGCRAPALLGAATAAAAVAVPLAANAVLHVPAVEGRVLASRARLLPYRDELRYWALPWKAGEDSAERFAKEAIRRMDASGGALYADSTSAPPLMLRFSDRTEPWELYTPWNDASGFTAAAEAGRPVFAVSPVAGYCPGAALSTGRVAGLFDGE